MLSHSQEKAMKHGTGPMLVLAGPGSGKTFTILQRLRYLIEEGHVNPASILVISFSKASTAELKKRFHRLTENHPYPVNFATFHACFFHILQNTFHYTSKNIIREEEKRNIIKTILTDPQYGEESTLERQNEILQKISYYKNREETELSKKETENFQHIFQAFQEEMQRVKKLDFDDMGTLCLKLLETQPDIRRKWQEKFQYLLIDEFQDINPVQFQIVQLLAGERRNLFVVGDDDQAIYGFRGASPEIMLSFREYYPECEQVLLETNYRCSGNIVKKAGEVIKENQLRYQKEILAKNPNGKPVIFAAFKERQREYEYIGCRIEDLWKERGQSLSEIACIYRTNGDMAALAEYFVRHKIPFQMKEKCNSIFQHFIAKDLLAYLQFFKEGGLRRDFFVIMNKPLRYLARSACKEEVVSLRELRKYYASKCYMQEILYGLERDKKWVERLDLYASVNYIRKSMGYDSYLGKYASENGESLEELLEIADFIQNSVRGVKDVRDWRREIAEYEESLRKSMEGALEDKEGVCLLTMHACKGLEFSYVFLPDCNEGKIPHKRSITKEEIEEERRMFYVAMTRAKEQLEILYLEDKHKKKIPPSRFLKINREDIVRKE